MGKWRVKDGLFCVPRIYGGGGYEWRENWVLRRNWPPQSKKHCAIFYLWSFPQVFNFKCRLMDVEESICSTYTKKTSVVLFSIREQNKNHIQLLVPWSKEIWITAFSLYQTNWIFTKLPKVLAKICDYFIQGAKFGGANFPTVSF